MRLLKGDRMLESFWQYKLDTLTPWGLNVRQVETQFYHLLSFLASITCASSVLLNIMAYYCAFAVFISLFATSKGY